MEMQHWSGGTIDPKTIIQNLHDWIFEQEAQRDPKPED